jgi:predicted histidine transporter YuiF (NhaC family)
VSLCLGMPTEKDVLESPFLNATVPSVNHHILKRVNPQAKNANQENIKKRRKERYKKKILNGKERISGAAIGVVIWGAFLFQWMVIAIIIGGIIGFIVVFLLQKYRRIKTKFPLIITKIKKKFEKKST